MVVIFIDNDPSSLKIRSIFPPDDDVIGVGDDTNGDPIAVTVGKLLPTIDAVAGGALGSGSNVISGSSFVIVMISLWLCDTNYQVNVSSNYNGNKCKREHREPTAN